MKRRHRFLLPPLALSLALASAWALVPSTPAYAQERDTKVHNDRQDVLAEGNWIYNDLEKGRQAALAAKKPLLVVLRCIP